MRTSEIIAHEPKNPKTPRQDRDDAVNSIWMNTTRLDDLVRDGDSPRRESMLHVISADLIQQVAKLMHAIRLQEEDESE